MIGKFGCGRSSFSEDWTASSVRADGRCRASLLRWLELRDGSLKDYALPSRPDNSAHMSTRQYARLVDECVTGIGLPSEDYGTRSLRRTKASIIYKATGNLRAVQMRTPLSSAARAMRMPPVHAKCEVPPLAIITRSTGTDVRWNNSDPGCAISIGIPDNLWDQARSPPLSCGFDETSEVAAGDRGLVDPEAIDAHRPPGASSG